MKNRIIPFLMVALAFAACEKKDRITITGTLSDGAGQTLYLDRGIGYTKKVIDSTTIRKDNFFSFKVHTEYPDFFTLRGKGGEILLAIAPEEQAVNVVSSYNKPADSYIVEGSLASSRILEFNQHLFPVLEKAHKLSSKYSTMKPGKNRDQVEADYLALYNELADYSRQFILSNAMNLSSYYVLYQKFDGQINIMDEYADNHYYKVVASSLSAFFPNSPYTKAILDHLKQITQAYRQLQISELLKNADRTLPEIRLPNVKGDTISLLNIKKRLVILDFTALTTEKSKVYIEEMKQVYNKFKDRGVEIYQVSLDPTRLYWEDAVKSFQIPWISVWDEGGINGSIYTASWNVQAIPANYIINGDMDVVGKNLYGRNLMDRLEDLLAR